MDYLSIRNMITLTPSAAQKIKDIIARNNEVAGTCFRITIKGGGCSGFAYDFGLSNPLTQIDDQDIVEESLGVKIVIDPVSYQYISDITVDYKESLIESHFSIHNPSASGE